MGKVKLFNSKLSKKKHTLYNTVHKGLVHLGLVETGLTVVQFIQVPLSMLRSSRVARQGKDEARW